MSPTFAKTTDRPPYGNYPVIDSTKRGPGPLLVQNVSGINKGQYLRLSKKCYMGYEKEEMPWAST